MLTKSEIAALEKTRGAVITFYNEITALSKKAPNGAVNKFKLTFVNDIVRDCEDLLPENMRPFKNFSGFDEDDLPTNSDVALILAQYVQAVENHRANNIHMDMGEWYYTGEDEDDLVRTAPPLNIRG